MSSTSPPNEQPPSFVTGPEELATSINRLRAECDAASRASTQAVLLHELGVLEERNGDETAAARDHLASVNTDPEFCEPLERLVAIIQRRQSYKNLGRVLERLVRIADTPVERARALLDQAAFLADHDDDLDGARAALLEGCEETPEDPALWLALEFVAERLTDTALVERAILARAELTENPTLRGLLLVELGERRALQGAFESALEVLNRAANEGGEARFSALLAEERLTRSHDHPELEAKALERQGGLILSAILDGAAGDASGVPRLRRGHADLADVWLRAAEIHKRRGELAESVALLDRAIREAPEELMLAHARIRLAEVTGDTEVAARLATFQLERGVSGEPGAALWLRLAEAAAGEGDRGSALSAVEKALALAPKSAPARALHLDLLSSENDPPRLATALENLTDQLEVDAAKSNAYLAAADIWARLAGDVSGAKAALTQAAMFGAPPALIARFARMLAAVVGDASWYEEATRRLLAQGATEDEHVELWMELARARALRAEVPGAAAAFSAIAAAPRGAWLGNALGAYLIPWLSRQDNATSLPSDYRPWSALSALAEHEADLDAQRALRTIVALRALRAKDRDTATTQLLELHDRDPSDLVATGALSILLRARGELEKAKESLWRSAEEVSDGELATALRMASGLLSWRLGDRRQALDAFERASADHPQASANLLAWGLRAASADDPAARARALDALSDTDPALALLERFALEIGKGRSEDAAWDALRSLQSFADQELTRAGELARALWGLGGEADSTRRDALDSLASRSPSAARLARAMAHQLELGTGNGEERLDPERLLQSAERWAECDSALAPALEWLSFAIGVSDVRREIDARRALSARLGAPASQAMAASAAIAVAISSEGNRDLLPSDGAAVKLANLELAGPGSNPEKRAKALLEAQTAMGEDCGAMAIALAGFNQLAAGELEGAVESFRTVIEAYPTEVIGWEGLRAAAMAQGDRATLAEASAALGDAVTDGALGAQLWEEAASILLDELNDGMRGEFALSRATDRDIERFSAFDRLFRIVRARKDGPRLLELIERRLQVATEVEERVRLVWERARTLRAAGDREGALAALAHVRELEPDHVGALALMGEISITLQRFEDAADNLARLAQHPDAPGQQRLMSGVASADLYENRLESPERALEVLMGLYRAGLTTLPVRERLARIAAKTGTWDQATEVLEQLMNERETVHGRVEAARLAMAIYRDELHMPEAGQEAVARLLVESPADGEALDLVLSGVFAQSLTQTLLARGLSVLVSELEREPIDELSVDRVARIAERLNRLPLRQAALGVLVALGADARQIDPELSALDERVARVPRIAIDESSLPSLADPEDGGPIGQLMVAIGSTVSEALGPGLAALGVSKRERVDPRAGLTLRNEVAAWAGALGIGEFELYVGGHDPEGVCAVPTELPALVLGRELTAPLSPFHRQAVARELFSIRRGTSVLRHRETEEIHALIVAACRIAEVDLPSPPFAMLPEFQRQLTREMPRRVRKVLPELARAVQSSSQDPSAWYNAAASTLDRMAVLAAGDVSWVLAVDARQRGRMPAALQGQQRARRLLSFVLSPTYLELREKLGMGVR